MYIPEYFKEERWTVIEDFLHKNSFATLISVHENKPMVTHIPVELVTAGDVKKLEGHMSKANKHWHNLRKEADVLVAFTGPNAYISPAWYNHTNVPTWNYISVHISGKIKIIEDPVEILPILERQVKKYESANQTSFNMHALSAEFIANEIRGTIGFEITIENMEANFKLSQNRNREDFDNVVKELEQRTTVSGGGCPITEEMRKQLTKLKG